MARAGHGDDAVGPDVGDLCRLQHARARGQVEHRLARLLAPGEVLEARDETVAVRRRQHEAAVVVAAGQGPERRARGRREAAGQRLAVAARGGQRVHGGGVAAAFRIQERHLLRAARAHRRQQAVAIAVRQRGGIHVVALRGADPALFRQHHRHRLAGDQFGFVQGLGGIALHQRRQARVAELLGVRGQLVLDQLLQLGLRLQDAGDLLAFGLQFVLLAADLHFLQAGELLELGIEDVVGLFLAQREARDQRRLRFVLGADDADHFIQVEEGDQQAFQQVQAALDLLLAVLEAAGDGVGAEHQPLVQHRLEVLDRRLAVQADHIEVDPVALLQVGGGEQVAHQLLGIHAVGTGDQHHTHRVGMVGFVADVFQPRQLLGAHLRGDLLDHLGRRHLVGQRVDHDVLAFLLEGGAGTHAAVAGFVDGAQVGQRRDDLRRGRIVGAAHVFAQVGDGGIGVVKQADAGADDFIEVMWRHIGGHAHGDAGGAVQQQVRQAGRHPCGFFQRAVKIGCPVHGALAQFAQQHFGDGGQLGFGVTHRGERLGIVRRAEVALAFDQRIAVRKRLRHQHQRFVAGAVAVRVVLADHVADGACGLLRLGAGVQAELAHRIDDAPLHRLQPVADEGQGAVQHHVHRVVEVGALGVLAQRDLLEAVEGGADRFGHCGRTVCGSENPAILPAAPSQPPIPGSSGPPSHSQRASQAVVKAMARVRGAPTRRKSPNV